MTREGSLRGKMLKETAYVRIYNLVIDELLSI